MYKAVNKNKAIRRYMEVLALHTGTPVKTTQVLSMLLNIKELLLELKRIDSPVCFLKEKFENGIFVPKYEKSSVMIAYMCIKPC